jgi:hypothetical protein
MTLYRFGWQRLLISQVPQKGGKRYIAAPGSPPPRDWSPEWSRVTAAGQTALISLNEIAKDFSAGGGSAAFAARQSEINGKIAATTAQIDQALALNSIIPASWFGANLADRNTAIASLEQSKNNLNRYIGTWTPSKIDLISDEIDRQTLLLATQNRILKGPIESMPPSGAYPSGSWQHSMWARGYSLQEISWAEEEISRDPVIQASVNDRAFYVKLIEDKIQDGIVGGKIQPAAQREIIQLGSTPRQDPGLLLISTGSSTITRIPTGPIGGVGTNQTGIAATYYDPVYGEDDKVYTNSGAVPVGIRWSKSPWVISGARVIPETFAACGTGSYVEGSSTTQYIDIVYGEDGNSYRNPAFVPVGVSWSRFPWANVSVGQEMRMPLPPRGLVPGSKQFQVWRRRQTRNAVFSTSGRVTPNFGDSAGWNVPTSLEVPRITQPAGQSFQPWCGTGVVSGQPWESVMIGEGCEVSHLDTIRKFFASAKLAPKADQVQIARDICQRLKNQDLLMPNVALVAPVAVSQQSPALFALDAANTSVANIPGVTRQSISSRTIAAQNLAARRQSSRVRRSAFR